MSGLYQAFETNKDLENSGIELDYGKNSKGAPIRIRIARAGGANKRFAKVLDRLLRPYKRQLANDQLSDDVAKDVMIQAYADAVVLGWEGVGDREGNPMEFSRENVVKLFTDLPELFLDVQQQSQKAALFLVDILEGEQGNSQKS